MIREVLLCAKSGTHPKSVDDLNSAVIPDGASLALSGAMPGLVGATFRRGGQFASFRSVITHDARDPAAVHSHDGLYEGILTIRLFNLLIKQLGHVFLQRGIYISVKMLKAILDSPGTDHDIQINSSKIAPEVLSEINWDETREVMIRLGQ